MTLIELARRVDVLETALRQLRERVEQESRQRPWWREDAGRFAQDAVFDEIVDLGKSYRESQHPDRQKKRSTKNDHS